MVRGDRTYKLASSTTSEDGRHVKSLGEPCRGLCHDEVTNRTSLAGAGLLKIAILQNPAHASYPPGDRSAIG